MRGRRNSSFVKEPPTSTQGEQSVLLNSNCSVLYPSLIVFLKSLYSYIKLYVNVGNIDIDLELQISAQKWNANMSVDSLNFSDITIK